MTGQLATSLENRKQGRIFFLVVALHAIVLYGLCLQKHRPIHRDAETRVDLIWLKPPTPKAIKPVPARPVPEKPLAASPKASPLPALQQDTKHAEQEVPVQAQTNDKKPLDLQKVLNDIGPAIRKLDGEQPAGQALQADRLQPTLESRLEKVLANAKRAPKFYEAARIEALSSGTELEDGIIKYKITTFAGSYCVTYKDGAQVYKGTCPIMQF